MRIFTASVHRNTIHLFGRTEGSGAQITRVECRPHLILGSLPSDLFEKMARHSASRKRERYPGFNVEKAVDEAVPPEVEVLRGQDIVSYCESGEKLFYKVTLPDIYSWYNLRRMLREPVELCYPEGVLSYQCGAVVYNDHVNPAMQYIIDTGLEMCGAGPRFTALSYDLECHLRTVKGKLVFPNSALDPIITIGAVTDDRKVVFCLYETPLHADIDVRWFSSESSMLEAFNDFVRTVDPDFILGHNVNRFDNVYYRDRCKILGVKWLWSRVPGYESSIREVTTTSNQRGTQVSFRLDCPGRVVLDTYEKFRADHKLRNYKLNTLGEHFLNQYKVDLPYAQIPVKFQTPEGRLELAVYCVQDANLVLQLVRTQCKILNVVAMSNVTGVCPNGILNRGQGIRTITLMLRYALHSSPRLFIPRGEPNEGGFAGAVVLPPLRGKYDDVVLCVDFASLYPSIMRAMNMSYETLVSNETIALHNWVEGVDVRTVPDYVDGDRLQIVHNPENCSFVTARVREGLLPKILREVLAERTAVKALMKESEGPMRAVLNGKQLALKVVANSIYGFTGASVGFLPEPRIASSVTKYGRGLTLRTKDFVNNHPDWKSEVIYGDSVSSDTPVFVRLPNGVGKFVAIRDLGTKWGSSRGKQFAPCEYEVWSDSGWTSVERVIRHRTSKQMFRVYSSHGVVDVTSDHSLLLSDGTPVTAMEIQPETQLLHHELPVPVVEHPKLTYECGRTMGIGFMINRVFPLVVLSAPMDVVRGFFAGAMSRMGEGRLVGSKMMLSQFAYVCRLVGATCCFRSKGLMIRLCVSGEPQCLKVQPLGTTEDYVYDLTTSNHHFHVGPGSLIVHNTDSCFIRVPPSLCPPDDIERAHKVGEMMANEITKVFLKPVLMEYESAFKPPFLLLKKKRYIGNLCLPGKDPKTYIKGCECVRRDFAPIVKKTQLAMIDRLLQNDVEGAKALIKETFDNVYAGKVPLADLTLTRKLTQLPEHYKSKMPHVELAKRLGSQYVAGDRVEFLIRTGHEDLNQRAIAPSEVDKYVLDYHYYADRQLRKPLERIMELVTDDRLFKERRVTAPMTNAGIVRFFTRKPKPKPEPDAKRRRT
jgi:DNA polymerase elongation subunit (family B)